MNFKLLSTTIVNNRCNQEIIGSAILTTSLRFKMVYFQRKNSTKQAIKAVRKWISEEEI